MVETDQTLAAGTSQLDARASRLLKSAQRASEVAKNAYAAGLGTTQARVKQLTEAILANASKAKVSSKHFVSNVALKVDLLEKAHTKTRHYTGKAQEKAAVYKGNVSSALQQEDGGGPLGFPLSLLAWCGTLCGRSRNDGARWRELEPEPPTNSDTEFSSEFLVEAAERYAAELEAAADELEADVAHSQNTVPSS